VSGHGGKGHSTTNSKRQIRKPRKRDRDNDGEDEPDSERRMRAAVRNQGRLIKRAGAMVSSGVSEFQLASGDALERLVNRTERL
jgi:ATP-dependent RNA helicase DDX31/DBP7